MSVFQKNTGTHLQKRMFLDEPVDIARYDQIRYPWLQKLTNQQLGYFWRPEEVELFKDKKDFADLQPHEQHVFTSNLKRQILLDSVQGRAPSVAFLPICSLPEMESWIKVWTFSEEIHSMSYTWIIRNVYADPSRVFDEMLEIQEIVDCAKDISEHYDDLIRMTTEMLAAGVPLRSEWEGGLELQRLIWPCLMSVNILEGVRFYVSFACSWAFAETKRMEGNAKIIKFICRDENLHLAGTQQILKALQVEEPYYARIAKEEEEKSVELFRSAAEQEKEWARFLFNGGSMIGLNEKLLCDYVEYITNRRMGAVGLPKLYAEKGNPLPWTQKWIAGSEVQVAPQEVQISSYVIGGVDNDIGQMDLKEFKL